MSCFCTCLPTEVYVCICCHGIARYHANGDLVLDLLLTLCVTLGKSLYSLETLSIFENGDTISYPIWHWGISKVIQVDRIWIELGFIQIASGKEMNNCLILFPNIPGIGIVPHVAFFHGIRYFVTLSHFNSHCQGLWFYPRHTASLITNLRHLTYSVFSSLSLWNT